jgi:CBS domain-containing protein
MLEMMKRRVHHVALEKGGRIVGVFAAHDLMVVQGSSPLSLVREIVGQTKIEGLYELSLKSPRVVRALIYEGAKPGYVTRMITLINDYILDRMLTLLLEELGQPPLPFCWLLMGSEGRKEQTFRTDQDNGLIYQDPGSEAEAKAAREYFALLGSQAIEHLVRCGFPRCKGGIMASNPQWCQPLATWRHYFDRWITTPEPQDVLHATIFFDFRPGWGQMDLGSRLRDHLMRQVKGQEVFLRFLAKDTHAAQLPLTSIFRNFAVEREGPHKDKLDLKTKGLVPFVDFARLLSLRHGVRETNTLERFQMLVEGGNLSQDLHLKVSQAYEFQMQLRLVHQQVMHEEGLEPDNYINPQRLSELERRTLKEALAVISEIKSYLRETFRLSSA